MTDQYRRAFERACQMLEMFEDLEIRSALKQAASDENIPEGDAMGAFVEWSEKELGL